MTIQFTQTLRIAGAEVSAGTQQTLSESVEADFVHRGVAIFVTPNPAMPDNRPLRMGLINPVVIPEVLFAQGPDGRFIGTSYDATGSYMARLFVATGAADSLSKTAIAATEASTGLLSSAGTAIGSGLPCGVWWISSTRFMFAVRTTTSSFGSRCTFLYVCNYNGSAWTVGSNGPTLFDNLRAVLDVGTTGGTPVPDNTLLHRRSIATDGAGNWMQGDYNVASGRADGSTKDQVRIMRSTDDGLTWSKLVSWNTNGTTQQIRHVHGCVYDPFGRCWYFLLGDAPNNCIVRWDGVSSAPPDNTALSSFKNYAGWEVLQMGWMCETGDLSVHSDRIYYLPDDTGPTGPATLRSVILSRNKPLAYQLGRTFEWSSSSPNKGRAPLIGCNTPGGGAIWGSLYNADAVSGFDFWSTDNGIDTDKIATARDYSGATAGSLFDMYVEAGTNRLLITGADTRGVRLGSTAARGGTIIATLSSWDGKVRQLN